MNDQIYTYNLPVIFFARELLVCLGGTSHISAYKCQEFALAMTRNVEREIYNSSMV